jgi:hypothetical protein
LGDDGAFLAEGHSFNVAGGPLHPIGYNSRHTKRILEGARRDSAADVLVLGWSVGLSAMVGAARQQVGVKTAVGVATLACAVIGTPTQAQEVGPSAVPSVVGTASSKALPSAWLRLNVSFGTLRPFDANRVLVELVLHSKHGERLLSSRSLVLNAEGELNDTAARLTLETPPTEVPILLRITLLGLGGSTVCMYMRSYVLHRPDEARAKRIGLGSALEEAGYLGTFVVDIPGGDIARGVSHR